MFIIYVTNLSTKHKMLRRVNIFTKIKKYRRLEKEKIYFSVISFQKFLIFPIWTFLENAQNFVGAFH